MKAIDLSQEGLKSLSKLLIKAFAESKRTKECLYSLYKLNPAGEVISYNTFFKKRLVSHYVLMPAKANHKEKIKQLSYLLFIKYHYVMGFFLKWQKN